jgi:hypothetical protein
MAGRSLAERHDAHQHGADGRDEESATLVEHAYSIT